MSSEFLLEVFSIKIKIKGYLKNETEKTTENFEIFGIKNKEKITYIIDGTKYKLDIKEKNINLIRETEEFIHSMVFIPKKTTDTIYYIKEYKSEIPIKIHTKYIKKVNNYIEIAYKTIDNEIEYIYNIEMSDV